MICVDSTKTIDILLNNIPLLGERWKDNLDGIFMIPANRYKKHYFSETIYDDKFKDTKCLFKDEINILFSHFSLMKYEMEAIEMPLYASKVFPNANIAILFL